MFRNVAILAAAVCAVLFVVLLVSPATYVGTYGVVADAGADFMVRRASPMFAGLALLLWFARDATPSVLRTGVTASVALTFAGIALTGISAFQGGVASAMILVAAFGELLLAALLLIANRRR